VKVTTEGTNISLISRELSSYAEIETVNESPTFSRPTSTVRAESTTRTSLNTNSLISTDNKRQHRVVTDIFVPRIDSKGIGADVEERDVQ
jgi:hypothetical protein